MKKQLLNLLFLLSLSITIFAQTAKQSAPKPDLREQNLRKHVAYLASERLAGRRTGERGATFAAGYVANVFSNTKLKGGFAETKNGKTISSFMQPFSIITGIETAKTGNEFRIGVTNSTAPLPPDNLAPWKPIAFSPNGDLGDTAVVFAGYGIVSAESQIDDYAGLDVRDKIVLVFDGSTDAANPHSLLARFDARTKAKIARDKGAKGLMIISRMTRVEDDKLAQLKYDPTLGEAALPVVVVSRRTAAALLGTDENGLNRTESFVQTKNETELSALRAKLQNELSPRAAFKINLVKQKAEAYNVIGILEGTDPALKSEAIIIGAHYDHLGRGGQGSLAANSTAIHYGADDNASGVAGLLELARQLATEKKNKRTIIFIAFGGEEEGLLGSKYYVDNPAFPLAKTVAMINLDMIGRLNAEKLTVGGIGTAGEWKNLVENINKTIFTPIAAPVLTNDEELKADIEKSLADKKLNDVAVTVKGSNVVFTGTVPKGRMPEVLQIIQKIKPATVKNDLREDDGKAKPQKSKNVAAVEKSTPVRFDRPFVMQLNEDGFGPSDHSSFYGKQIPVLFFFTGTHADYHKPSDTAEKINYAGLNQVVEFVKEIVKTIDQNPKRPTYAVAKSSGMGEGRRGFNVSLGTIPSYAESNDGLLLDGVRDNSPAAKSGLKAGDKIIKLAGREIRNISDYTFVLGEMKAGTEYEVVFKRGSETLNLKIIPAARN